MASQELTTGYISLVTDTQKFMTMAAQKFAEKLIAYFNDAA
jgi:hypothetical protein